MKFNIKTLVASLAVGLSLVSCNNDFDEKMSPVSYPQKLEIGMWAPTTSDASSNQYTLNLSVNEQGDTICDVTMYSPVTELANVLHGGKLSYNDTTGVMTVDYDDSFYGGPARVMMAFKNNPNEAVVFLYKMSGDKAVRQDYTNMAKSDTISVYGQWQIANGEIISLSSNGTGSVLKDDAVLSSGSYTFDGKNGSFTTTDNKVYTLAMNEKGQMHIAYDGTTYYANHVQTTYVDDWEYVGSGTYNIWLFEASARNIELEHSACRAEYRINMYDVFSDIGLKPQRSDNYLSFNWNQKRGIVALTSSTTFYTGYNYQNYGIVQGVPSGSSSYDKGTFSFGISYQITGVGEFGADSDTFVLDEAI